MDNFPPSPSPLSSICFSLSTNQPKRRLNIGAHNYKSHYQFTKHNGFKDLSLLSWPQIIQWSLKPKPSSTRMDGSTESAVPLNSQSMRKKKKGRQPNNSTSPSFFTKFSRQLRKVLVFFLPFFFPPPKEKLQLMFFLFCLTFKS